MRINKLLNKLRMGCVRNNHPIFGISANSKKIKNNYIFVAIKGYTFDGYDYISEAIANGAKTIITYKEYKNYENVIVVNDPKDILAKILYIINYKALKKLFFIGVTGTNGKTSTATLIYNYLEYNKRRSFLICSNGAISIIKSKSYKNTTPSIEDIYENIAYAYKFKFKYFIIEVSSSASSEKRVEYIPFNIMIFTNFSLDHLDYHKTLDNYFEAKKHLFDSLDSNSLAIVNIDDEKGKEIVKDTKASVDYFGFKSELPICNINSSSYLSFLYDSKKYQTNLIGSFNIYNIMPLFIITKYLKINNNVNDFLIRFKKVNGRMNLFTIKNKKVIIDYAHTPVAVEESIKASLALKPERLIVVIGCGGNRDKSKRSVIGEILEKYDIIRVITSDNPRDEEPIMIINDITRNMKCNYIIKEDRKEAISLAITTASINDIVLILGKGIECYSEVKGERIHYSDIEYINSLDRK